MQGALTICPFSDLSTRFRQLFKFFEVRLTPMRCGCSQPELRRQVTEKEELWRFFKPVWIPESRTLEQAISQSMWDSELSLKTCPICHTDMNVGDFTTFAYLPEVFFISPVFMIKFWTDNNARATTDEKFIYPEWLDMSALRDDPNRPGDQTDCIYRLQSIIHSTNQDHDSRTRYKPSLRLSKDEWAQYGYDASSGAKYITFENINDPSKRETPEEAPCLLMYVRDRLVKSSDAPRLPDVVKPQPPLPRTNTELVNKYGEQSSNLQRFVDALDQPGEYGNTTAFENAKSELHKGRKTSHWMWYMFPQILLERRSRLGEFYAIKCLGEAIAYWKHPLLKRRYIELLQIMLDSPEANLEKLFGGKVDADKFEASLTLFVLTCNDKERGLFSDVFIKFGRAFHQNTVWKLVEWIKNEREALAWMTVYAGVPGDSGKQEANVLERGGLVTLVIRPEALAYDENGGRDQNTSDENQLRGPEYSLEAAKVLYMEVLRLAQMDIDDSGEDPEIVALWNERGKLIGKLVLGFAVPMGAPAPADTPQFRERARRLGRNLMLLSKPATEPAAASDAASDAVNDFGVEDGVVTDDNDNPDDVLPDDVLPDDILAKDEDYEPDNDYLFDDVHESEASRISVGDFGLDGSNDELGSGAELDEDPYNAVAIPSDPNDPRIAASQNWSVEKLKSEFQKEQLDARGLRNDAKKHRMKFLKHFELERDYSIYHESRLRQAVKERGIVLSSGRSVDKADKAELVDALTEYDTQTLGDLEFVEEGSGQTSSAEFESEEYQSSEVVTETDTSSANEATPRPKKRLRFEYEEEEDEIEDDEDDGDYTEGDYDDEDGETTPRGSPKGTSRIRTRY